MARGLWIAPLGDDDSFVAEHVERLLADARDRRLEFVYGRIRQIQPDGSESLLGEFPPRLSQVGLQAALYHAGLGFMELELGHALFGKPNDWGLVHRMMRAGVRMGMVDDVTVNYWPSLRSAALAQADEEAPTSSRLLADTERQLTEAQARARSSSSSAWLTSWFDPMLWMGRSSISPVVWRMSCGHAAGV